MGVTLAQLVKASVSQADVQRFESHLGHNWWSWLVKAVPCFHTGTRRRCSAVPSAYAALCFLRSNFHLDLALRPSPSLFCT